MSKKEILFSAKGRISRKNYWLGYIYSFLFFLLPALVIFGVFGAATLLIAMHPDYNNGLMGFASSRLGKAIASLVSLPLLICYLYSSFCVVIKRLHDLNYSGWFSLYRVIPIFFITFGTLYGALNLITFVIIIILGSVQGSVSANKYGANTLESVVPNI